MAHLSLHYFLSVSADYFTKSAVVPKLNMHGTNSFELADQESENFIHHKILTPQASGSPSLNPTPEECSMAPTLDTGSLVPQIAKDVNKKGNPNQNFSKNAKNSSAGSKHRSQISKMKTLQIERKDNIKTFNEKIYEKDGGYYCKCGKFTTGLRLKALSHALNCGKKVNRKAGAELCQAHAKFD